MATASLSPWAYMFPPMPHAAQPRAAECTGYDCTRTTEEVFFPTVLSLLLFCAYLALLGTCAYLQEVDWREVVEWLRRSHIHELRKRSAAFKPTKGGHEQSECVLCLEQFESGAQVPHHAHRAHARARPLPRMQACHSRARARPTGAPRVA